MDDIYIVDDIRIEKLVFGGYGLGRGRDGVVLIPGAASGEVVEYEDDGTHGGTRVGKITKIVEKSPKRRDPPCVYAGVCGGCDWLFLSYDEQVRCKKEIFLDCIDRIGKFDRSGIGDIDVYTANEFGYRSRAQIKIDRQNKIAGFFKRKTNDVVRVDKCPLLVDGINDVLTRLNSNPQLFDTISGNVSNIRILAGESVASDPVIKGLTGASTEIDVGGIKFLADGGSFFQSNKFLLETMGRWFVDGNGILPHVNNKNRYGYCIDLYGGIGFFSLMLSDSFSNVTLVENVSAQVRAATRNFRHNNKNHLKAILADVDKPGNLANLTKSREPDVIIIDPPRPGLTKNARKWLIDAAAPVILYISCNPSTFARDAGALVRDGGYELTRWALFDLYPNTHHIESGAVFCRG